MQRFTPLPDFLHTKHVWTPESDTKQYVRTRVSWSVVALSLMSDTRCTHQCCIRYRGIFPSERLTGQYTAGERLHNSGRHTPAGLLSSHTPAQTYTQIIQSKKHANDLHGTNKKIKQNLTWQTFSFKDVAPIFPFTSTWEERLSFKATGSTYRDEEKDIITQPHLWRKCNRVFFSWIDNQSLISWTITTNTPQVWELVFQCVQFASPQCRWPLSLPPAWGS